jgi:TusA-related sulfurtransferase
MSNNDDEPKAVVDTIGLYCPEPIFRLRTAIDELKAGEVLELQADDPAAEEDVKRWAKRTNNEILDLKKEGDIITFRIRKA